MFKEALLDNGDVESKIEMNLKEENKEQPYFALKVDNIDVLVSEED